MSVRAFNWAKGVFEATPLSHPQRLVLLGLCYHHRQTTGECFPSIETLGRFAGLGRRATQYALRDLEHCGLIRIVTGGKGRLNSSRYVLFGRFLGRTAVHPKKPRNGRAKGAPQSALKGAPLRVHRDAPDREDSLLREEGPSQEAEIIPFPLSIGRAG